MGKSDEIEKAALEILSKMDGSSGFDKTDMLNMFESGVCWAEGQSKDIDVSTDMIERIKAAKKSILENNGHLTYKADSSKDYWYEIFTSIYELGCEVEGETRTLCSSETLDDALWSVELLRNSKQNEPYGIDIWHRDDYGHPWNLKAIYRGVF